MSGRGARPRTETWSKSERGQTPIESAPVVSVVVPCYNQATYLDAALESLVAQTYANWECIVVDDGSPDDTADVTRRWGEADARGCFDSVSPKRPQGVDEPDASDAIIDPGPGRFRLLRQPNGGLSRARNAGIARARGKYILPFDADDLLNPRFLEKTITVLESDPQADIAYVHIASFGVINGVTRNGQFNLPAVMVANRIAYASPYRREVWEAVGDTTPI